MMTEKLTLLNRQLPQIDSLMVVVICLPFLFLFWSGQNWFFDSPGLLDPFMIMGHFIHYAEHLPLLDNDYKSSRLPWILPGALSYQLFGPVAGSYLLHTVFLVIALTSLYLTVKLTFNSRLAFLTTVLLAGYSHFYASGGWNYYTLAAIAYYFVTLLCLTLATTLLTWGGGVKGGEKFGCSWQE